MLEFKVVLAFTVDFIPDVFFLGTAFLEDDIGGDVVGAFFAGMLLGFGAVFSAAFVFAVRLGSFVDFVAPETVFVRLSPDRNFGTARGFASIV